MAGATNRAFKAAGIPKKAQAEIRVHAGGRLTLKAAVDIAAKHGIAIPDKVHAHMAATAAEGRKAALREASAQRGAKIARALGDASKAAMANRKARAAIDAAAKSGKSKSMAQKLTPEHSTALRKIVDQFDREVANERARWGETSATRLASKGIDPVILDVKPKTLHALADAGVLVVETRSKTASTLRRGAYGKWIGGSRTHAYTQFIVRPTDAARGALASE